MNLSSKNAIFHIIPAHLPKPATTISRFFKKFIKTFNFHDAEKQSLKFASTRRCCHQSTAFSILVLDLATSFTVDSVDFLLNDVAEGLLVDFDLLGSDGLVREGIKHGLLFLEQVRDTLVDGVGREKPVDKDVSGLAHAVGAGDGLALDGRLQLGFADDHDAGGLNIETCAAGDNPGDKNLTGGSLVEAVDDFLTLCRRDGTVNRLGALAAEHRILLIVSRK